MDKKSPNPKIRAKFGKSCLRRLDQWGDQVYLEIAITRLDTSSLFPVFTSSISHTECSQFLARIRLLIGLIRDVSNLEVLGMSLKIPILHKRRMAPISIRQFKTMMNGSWVCFAQNSPISIYKNIYRS